MLSRFFFSRSSARPQGFPGQLETMFPTCTWFFPGPPTGGTSPEHPLACKTNSPLIARDQRLCSKASDPSSSLYSSGYDQTPFGEINSGRLYERSPSPGHYLKPITRWGGWIESFAFRLSPAFTKTDLTFGGYWPDPPLLHAGVDFTREAKRWKERRKKKYASCYSLPFNEGVAKVQWWCKIECANPRSPRPISQCLPAPFFVCAQKSWRHLLKGSSLFILLLSARW